MSTTLSPARPRVSAARARAEADFRNLALWTVQGWLTMFFVAAGYAKLTEPMDTLTVLLRWPALASESLVRGIGGLEVGLALGLLAPLVSWRLGRPILMMAGFGLTALAAVMVVVHGLRLEPSLTIVNAILLAFAVTILWGRRAEAR